MLLYIIRHGIPDYTTDTLTEEGQKQAEAVVHRFRSVKLDRIFSSPLGRARQTAEPTARALGLPIEIRPFMSENTAGDFVCHDREGNRRFMCVRRDRVMSDPAILTSPDAFSHGLYLDDEKARQSFLELGAASDAFLSELGYQREPGTLAYRRIGKDGGRVAAFCHATFGLHWLSHLLGLPPHVFFCSASLATTGISLVRLKANAEGLAYPSLLQHADLSHLAMAGLPHPYDTEAIE